MAVRRPLIPIYTFVTDDESYDEMCRSSIEAGFASSRSSLHGLKATGDRRGGSWRARAILADVGARRVMRGV
jgi:hypothetical protein